jgi:GntR family transcriptional regulator, transcriptional repressor for pyruvate dehydrogenase complex
MSDSDGTLRTDSNSARGDDSPASVRKTARPLGPEDVAHQMLDHLLSGAVAPGDRLPPERKLAEMFGTGRSVVREAMKSLNFLGLIDVRQGDGNYFKPTGSDLLPRAVQWGLLVARPRVRDLIEARRHVEVLLAELAAERRTDAAVLELRTILEDMEREQDLEKFVETDIAFHIAIAMMADNSVLADVLRSIRVLLHVWISRVVQAAGETHTTCTEHKAIYTAIERGNPVKARAAMKLHMDSATTRLLATIESDLPV